MIDVDALIAERAALVGILDEGSLGGLEIGIYERIDEIDAELEKLGVEIDE